MQNKETEAARINPNEKTDQSVQVRIDITNQQLDEKNRRGARQNGDQQNQQAATFHAGEKSTDSSTMTE